MVIGLHFIGICLLLSDICFVYYATANHFAQPTNNGYHFNTTEDFISSFGYDVQRHTILSEDGFLLTSYRIPRKGPPVIIHHGFQQSSDAWVMRGPNKDLAFMLADQGRDVWLADQRGNFYSRSHSYLSPNNPTFWNYSFHESGFYDLPAMMEYILKLTGRRNLDYIGHSAGALMPIVMCALKPHMNSKLRSVISLAPASFYNTTYETIVEAFVHRITPILTFFKINFGANEIFPRTEQLEKFYRTACYKSSPFFKICLLVLELIGINFDRKYDKQLVDFALTFPRGASYKTLIHLEQTTKTGRVALFDYGPRKNLKIYGTTYNPVYDFNLVTAPFAFIYSEGDTNVLADDVELMALKMPNVILNYRIKKSVINFNHLDLLWAPEATRYVFNYIFDIFYHFDKTEIAN